MAFSTNSVLLCVSVSPELVAVPSVVVRRTSTSLANVPSSTLTATVTEPSSSSTSYRDLSNPITAAVSRERYTFS